jgi:hypothetical protein
MVEVFMTNIREPFQAKKVLSVLKSGFPELKLNFDLDDSARSYPCGHTILRAEGSSIHAGSIIKAVEKAGFTSAILADKICK